MAERFFNGGVTTITAAVPSSGATTITLAAPPAGIPTSSGDTFRIRLSTTADGTGTPEIFIVQGGPGPGYTIVSRAQESAGGPNAYPAGSYAYVGDFTAAGLNGSFARRDIADTLAGPLSITNGVSGNLSITGNLTTTGPVTIAPGTNLPAAVSSWGSTMVKIQDLLLQTPTNPVTFSSIPQGYRSLRVQWIARGDASASASDINLQFNGDVGANYGYMQLYGLNNTANSTTANWGQTFIQIGRMPAATAQALWASTGTLDIPFYAQTSWAKTCVATTLDFETIATTAEYLLVRGGLWGSVSAITSITLTAGAGTFVAGSIFALYGIP